MFDFLKRGRWSLTRLSRRETLNRRSSPAPCVLSVFLVSKYELSSASYYIRTRDREGCNFIARGSAVVLKYRLPRSPSCLPCRRMLHLGALIRGLRARAVKVYYCTMVTFVVLSTRDYVTYPDRQIYLPPSELRAELKAGRRYSWYSPFTICQSRIIRRPSIHCCCFTHLYTSSAFEYYFPSVVPRSEEGSFDNKTNIRS